MADTSGNRSNYGMALIEMLSAEQKEANAAHKEAKERQAAARRKLLEAQQEAQQADQDVAETHAHREACKTQVRTAIDSMSR